jgi:hypothetical protein
VSHIVQFRRPETPNAVSRMFISAQCDSLEHIHHLEMLGCTIIDVSPPLQEAPPKSRPDRTTPC